MMLSKFADPKSFNIESLRYWKHSLVMGDELAQMAERRPDIVLLTADLMFSNGTEVFKERYPERYLNLGIAEQNMFSVAAGLASCGLRPYVSTFASFAALTCCEQMRTDLSYTRMPVRILAHHAGIAMGYYGTSHHAVEDLAITRSMSHMTVVAPCDAQAIRAILRDTIDVPGPVYIRLGRGEEPVVYSEVPTFSYGRLRTVREGRDATIIATGHGVKVSLDAAAQLADGGFDVRVLDGIYIKPLDVEAIVNCARETGAILVVEEHNPNGGLGGAVAEALAESGVPAKFRRHCLPDEYSLIAPPTHLYRHYGLTTDGVAAAMLKLVEARRTAAVSKPSSR